MAGKPNATKNAIADAEAGLGTWISVHTADPGTTGASEVSGGSPAYARKQTTWGAASAGVRTGSLVSIDIPSSTTVAYVGIWSASTAGTWVDGIAITSEVFAGQGILEVTPTITGS